MPGTHHRATTRRISIWWWLVSGAGALVAIIAVIAWFGGQVAPDGQSYLSDPDKIVLALIGAAVSVAGILIPTLRNIQRDTSATTEHVVNSHGSTILRDDIDEIKEIVKSVRAEQREQRRDINGLRSEIGQLRATERDQWAEIERTAGRRRHRDPDNTDT